MKLHTRMLTVLADDLAALGTDSIAIVLSHYSVMSGDDFDELKTIMAARHPNVSLRRL